MSLLRYTHVIYAIIVWAYVFVFIKPKRLRSLIPAAVIGLLTIFAMDEFVITLRLYQFNKPLVNVLGTPLFHLIFGAGAGVIFIHYMKRSFARRFFTVLLFTFITMGLEYVAELAGVASRLNGYALQHSFLVDFAGLLILLFFTEGFIGEKLYSWKW